MYATAEHREQHSPPLANLPLTSLDSNLEVFQAMKFLKTNPSLAEYIRNLPSPRDALHIATECRGQQRKDWFDVNVRKMDEVLALKFAPDSELADLLLRTGNREIIEDSPVRNDAAVIHRTRLTRATLG
jgi:predicted NAD-dependent protein-ADP-ribosyltransferase YbiA (DUF1768 family)